MRGDRATVTNGSQTAAARVRRERIVDLQSRVEQAESTIRAIQEGEIDAVVVNGPNGPQVYTLEGADHPYRVLVEQMHEGTLTIDDDGVILYCNHQFAAMIGARPENVTGTVFSRLLLRADAVSFPGMAEAATLRGHCFGDAAIKASDGNAIPIRISLTSLDIGGTRVLCALTTDLREQRRNEAIMRDEQLSRLILEQAGEAVVVIDPAGIVIRGSESARSLARGPLLANHFDRVFCIASSGQALNAEHILTEMRSFRSVRGFEGEILRGDGELASVVISASPLSSDTQQLLGCVITLTDITEIKRAEKALARQAAELSQANSDLQQFAHSASHDLREPLRQLAVFSELLQAKYGNQLDAEAAQLIRYTVESAHRMEGLLHGLLDYTQATGAPHAVPEHADTAEILARTLAMFEAQIGEAGARVEYGDLPALKVHEVHLIQLFQNLIGNALKYRGESEPMIRIAATRRGPMWTISIADNGIGIPHEYQDQVFGLFKRLHGGTKYTGSGIGLAICQKIVQRYGGKIWVESQPGAGSTFAFTLPGGSDEIYKR